MSIILDLVQKRIIEEEHRRGAEGRELESVRVAPFVLEAVEHELERMSRVNIDEDFEPSGEVSDVMVMGVVVEPDDDLSAMEFDNE